MDINVKYDSSSNELSAIMAQYGSDKGSPGNNGHHNYTILYYPLFNPVRHAQLRVFELGLGTNNVNIPSNMGAGGHPGASLRGWKQFFPNAKVFGADIDKNILFEEDRIKTFYCDQCSSLAIKEMWDNPKLQKKFHIIVEDGLHTFSANVCFFENSIHKLKRGGIFVIEDIVRSDINQYINKMNEWKLKYHNLKFRLEIIPHARNNHDNILLLVQKY
jgi:SAM-dependent methyltransferase